MSDDPENYMVFPPKYLVNLTVYVHQFLKRKENKRQRRKKSLSRKT